VSKTRPRKGGPGKPRGKRATPKRARDVIEDLLSERAPGRGFSNRLEREARASADSAARAAGERQDLTGLATFTVDPVSARDFDDAVSARREDDGVRLWIHIADVAAHVRAGSALDQMAYDRATSIYVPGIVEPMLPAALSSDACSLVPGEERLAVTSEIVLGGSGQVRSARFYRSLIRSDARLSYDELDLYFTDRERPPEAIAEPLALARQAAAVLAERRASTSLAVESTEPEFHFKGKEVVGAFDVAQTESHRLIEQLMIVTNEQVAEVLERKRVPALYRVHEPPDPSRIEELLTKLAALDVPAPPLPNDLSPSQAGEIAARASHMVLREAARRGHGREAYTSLVLRSLKQAYYSHRNLGHAGLGSAAYSHFTSPIRRYPDLIAHRALLSAVGIGERAPSPSEVREAGPHTSDREREAMRIERDADDICAAFLLERELRAHGPESRFEGEVVGLVRAGAFVRFAGEMATIYEGFLPARHLRGEYFELDETGTRLVGRRTGRALRLGDPLSVRVGGVEAERGRVDLVPAGE
jgi:ribonuclease R